MGLIENEWFIEVPWGRICVVAWGDCCNLGCNPPVLILHGLADSLASFRPLITRLPTNFYYVGFELPGHGKSDSYPPGLGITLESVSHCIEVVRRHFRWEKFIYLAHSVGGVIGRLYNLSHPGRFIAAIELDQTTRRFGHGIEELPLWFQRTYGTYYDRYHKNIVPKEERPTYTWDQMTEKVLKERPELTPDPVRATIERSSESAGNEKIRFTSDTRRPIFYGPPYSRAQIRALYDSLTTPTLAVVSEDSVRNKGFSNLPFLLEESRYYRVRSVPGGHDVHVAHPERVAPYVSQFLLHGLQGLDRRAKL